MKKTLKCVLVLTLVVLALFAITVLGASAATYTTDADAITAGDVVKVEYTKSGAATTEYYASISAAVTGMGDAIADGATITVLGDIATDAATTISQGTVTINGGDFTATGLALTISGGTVTIDGLNIINTTSNVNAIYVSGNAVIKISNATIQGTDSAIWVAATVSTPIEISNSHLKGYVTDASADYGYAFYVGGNVGVHATNVTFEQAHASGIAGSQGGSDSVIRVDSAEVLDGNKDYRWHMSGCTLIADEATIPYFFLNNSLTIVSSEGGLTITRSDANAAAHIFYVKSGTLTLTGSEAAPLKVSQTANGYYGCAFYMANGTKVVLDHAEVTGTRRIVYVNAAATVTIQATNSKLTTTVGDKWNGLVYFEPGSSKTVTLNLTLEGCDVQMQGYLVAFSSASNTATANITADDATTITFAKSNGAQLFRSNTSTTTTVTMNGGNYTSSYGSIVLDQANYTLTMNDVNFKGGTYGVVRVGAAGATVTVNGGSYVSASTTWAFFDIRYSSTVNIYGGYFECKDDVMFNVGGTATLNIYGGYFHRVSAESENSTFVSAGSAAQGTTASFGSGTANIYGGTFVADYTDVGSVFSIYDMDSTLNAAAYNGMGSAVITLNEGIVETEQDASFNFWHNSIKVFNTVSLRLNAEGDVAQSGLRFTSYITKAFIDMIDGLKDDSTAVTYGTVVVPVKYLEGVSYFSTATVSNALVIPASAGMREDENGGIFIRASIYNLPRASEDEGNTTEMLYNDAYAATVYAEYVKDGKTVRNYANFDVDLHSADAATLATDALKDVVYGEASGEYVNPVVVNGTLAFSKHTEEELAVISVYAADFADTAKVNGKIYGTLEKALEKAGEGDTVYLLKDVTLDGVITIAQNVVIDGQGYTLTMPADANAHVFSIAEGANLTVTNLNAANEGTAPWKNSIFTFTGVATLTVDGGEYSAAGVVLYGEGCGASTVTLNAPVFTTLSANNGNAAPILVNAAMTLNINGGTYTTNENTSTGNALRIMNASATVTINGGTFDAANGAHVIFVNEVTREVLIGEETATFANTDAIEYHGAYQAFEVDGVLYNTWADAMNAVAAEGTITLVKNFDTTTATMTVTKDVTLDGNNCIITDAKAMTGHVFTFSGYNFIVNNLTVVSAGTGGWTDAIFFANGTSSIEINGGSYSAVYMVIQANTTSAHTTITVNDAEFITTTKHTSGTQNYAPIMVDGAGDTITLSGVTFTSGNAVSGACIRANKNTTLIIDSEVTFNAYKQNQNYSGTYGLYFTGTPTTAPTGLENVTFNVIE